MPDLPPSALVAFVVYRRPMWDEAANLTRDA